MYPLQKLRNALTLKFGAVVMGGALALALALPTHAQEESMLRYGSLTEPRGLSLHGTEVGFTFVPLQAIYESLLRLGADMSLKPHLAESWQQVDETTYEVKLRKGVKFHSGNPFTAEDVKQTWDRHLHTDQAGFLTDLLEPVREIIVKDELTLEIQLERPYGPFIYVLSMPHSAISDMKRFAEVGAEGLDREPSGTGPYMLDRWNKGAELVLKANPNYWGGQLPVDRIQFRFIPEAAARAIALETGEVDLVETLAAPDISRLVASPDIEVTDVYELRSVMWLFNMRHKMLRDLAVRKAIAHAIDYDLAMSSILGEAGRPMHGYVPVGTFGYKEFKYAFDPKTATRLLEEAGWSKNQESGFFEKDGEVLSFTHVSGGHLPGEVMVAEAIQTLLREFGVDMKIKVWDRVDHTSRMWENARQGKSSGGREPDFGTTQWDWGIRTVDASAALDPTFSCGGDRNFGHYCNPAYDDLIKLAVSGLPAEERIARFAEAQQIVFEAVPALPMYQPRLTMAWRKEVKGMQPTPTRVIYFNDLRLER